MSLALAFSLKWDKSLTVVFLFNNIILFTVAYLGATFGEQIDWFRGELSRQTSKVKTLTDFSRVIVNSSHIGLMVLNEKGSIVYANPEARDNLFPFPLENKPLSHLFPDLWQKIQNQPQLHWDWEFKNRVFELSFSQFWEAESKQKGYVLMFDDRTEQKSLESQLRKKEKNGSYWSVVSRSRS